MASPAAGWHIPGRDMEYDTVIGLETHVQLKTRSKMWCGCPNTFGAEPNTLVCPVCLGMPGVLPVANEEALRLTVLTGFLLNCEIPESAKFDRKNYFYPDSAKNYQVTQYDRPSTRNGWMEFEFAGASGRESDWRESASRGRTSRRTSARTTTLSGTVVWISTGPACRCWRSFPNPTSPDPTWHTPTSGR